MEQFSRKNHFNELLDQVQGKNGTDISDEDIQKIMEEYNNHDNIRQVLQKLGMQRYYEKIPYIMYRLKGIPPLQLTLETEMDLKQMFNAISGSKKLPSYSYILYRLLNRLGITAYACRIKSPEKLQIYDQLWQNIDLHVT